ncbi:MAG: hypothetical protein ACXAC2_00655 [Candidatus Kariarchaeaceae archaeon]|jgi:hypothetical protein
MAKDKILSGFGSFEIRTDGAITFIVCSSSNKPTVITLSPGDSIFFEYENMKENREKWEAMLTYTNLKHK